jgi:hypothetical protein
MMAAAAADAGFEAAGAGAQAASTPGFAGHGRRHPAASGPAAVPSPARIQLAEPTQAQARAQGPRLQAPWGCDTGPIQGMQPADCGLPPGQGRLRAAAPGCRQGCRAAGLRQAHRQPRQRSTWPGGRDGSRQRRACIRHAPSRCNGSANHGGPPLPLLVSVRISSVANGLRGHPLARLWVRNSPRAAPGGQPTGAAAVGD